MASNCQVRAWAQGVMAVAAAVSPPCAGTRAWMQGDMPFDHPEPVHPCAEASTGRGSPRPDRMCGGLRRRYRRALSGVQGGPTGPAGPWKMAVDTAIRGQPGKIGGKG